MDRHGPFLSGAHHAILASAHGGTLDPMGPSTLSSTGRDWREQGGIDHREATTYPLPRAWAPEVRACQEVPMKAVEGATAPGGPATASPEAIAFGAALVVVARVSPEVASSIRQELADQRSNLKLIASENFASPAVLLAMGNWLSDKYAEGSPGHRFYAGCDNIDTIERRVDELACALFGADHAYAQPHSGIDANLVAFWAVLSQRVESPALARLATGHVNDLSDDDWEALRQQLVSQTLLGMSF